MKLYCKLLFTIYIADLLHIIIILSACETVYVFLTLPTISESSTSTLHEVQLSYVAYGQKL